MSIHKILYTLAVIMPVIAIYFLASCSGSAGRKARKSVPVSNVVHPEWAVDANIYEVNVRQYTPEGTFAAFAGHLPRLKEMGVEILWFMPIHPIGVVERKGSLGSYYSVKDYKGINPEFGTLQDFREIVARAHDLGMKVIIDWVANHTAWDHPWVEEHPEWYTRDSAGNMVSPFDWSDVVDLNFENGEMRDAMIDALKYWVTEADIDGYRCDVAGLVPTDFWERVRQELDSIKPVFMLAEAEEPELQVNAFDANYAWEMHHIMNDIAAGKKNANDLETYFKKEDTLYPKNTYRMYFTSNHDENSWNGTEYERMGEGAQTFAVLCATVPGMPLIYSGQEAAFNERLQFFEKDTIEWGDYPLEEFYKTLLFLKKDNTALWNGEKGGSFKRIITGNQEAVYAFKRIKDEDVIVVALNLSPQTVVTTWDPGLPEGEYNEAFTGDEVMPLPGELVLEPWEYNIWVGK